MRTPDGYTITPAAVTTMNDAEVTEAAQLRQLERILEERPDSRLIRTGNANVNAQLLAINDKLGFTYAWQSTLWQLPIAEARKATDPVAGAANA
jgi:hypothetical protein